MFSTFKHFLDEVLEPDRGPAAPGVPSLRLAAAVLLVEVMRAGGDITGDERAAARHALGLQFGLGPDEMEPLLQQAEQESLGAYDYFRFTNPLDEQLPHPQKIALVEALWQVAYADLELDAAENTVISKVADLLHVSHGEYIAAKLRAKCDAAGPGES